MKALNETQLPPINICRNQVKMLESMLTMTPSECVELRRLTESEVNNISKSVVISVLAKAKKYMMEATCFADISKTRGDITKHADYKNFLESVKIMKRINTLPVSLKDVVNQLENVNKFLTTNRSIFQTAFKEQNLNVVMFYNSLAVNMFGAGVVLISHVSQTMTGDKSYASVINSTLGEETFTSSLATISAKIQDGTAQVFVKRSIEDDTAQLQESFTLGTAAIFALGIGILWYIRDMVYYIYQLRYNFAKWLRSYGEFLKLRSYSLERQNKSVASKQKGVADAMLSLADSVAVETKTATSIVAKEVRSDNREMNSSRSGTVSSAATSNDDLMF